MQKTETLWGHPKGLFFFFMTEMWERFSYYGMRALLVLYMTQFLFKDPERAATVFGYTAFASILSSIFGELSVQAFSSQIYGIYTGLVYLTPFFGGLLSDRYLGKSRSVYIGGCLMAIGHLMMASESMFFPALIFLILGNGFFKPNITSQVGALYPLDDPRRDRAYTIFYMGVNAGAFLSPLICGTLGQVYGWHYGFGAAGIGMLGGLLIYHAGRKHYPPETPRIDQVKTVTNEKLTKDDWTRIYALGVLAFINIFFWGVYEQQGNSLQIWADQNANWNVFGWNMPSTWFQAFNPLLIIILATPLTLVWVWQQQKKKEPSSIAKMAIGCLFAMTGYFFMLFVASRLGGEGDTVHWLWLFGVVALFTIGELYISPIGLSLVSKISPPKMVAMLMGVWYLSSFFGNYAAGLIGSYYEKMGQTNFFLFQAALSGFAAALFMGAQWVFRKSLKEV